MNVRLQTIDDGLRPVPGWDVVSVLPAKVLVVGLGQTGFSVVRYLRRKGCDVRVLDTRENPPALEALRIDYPEVAVTTGPFDEAAFLDAELLVVSPGVSVESAMIIRAHEAGAEIVGDVELFAREVESLVIAVTGSNGKSTVTLLVEQMASAAGKKAVAAGNIGVPVLDLLERPKADLYVLELSSFQLETTSSLRCEAAVVLNVSEDHMDRYADVQAYAEAKRRIFSNARTWVINADDPVVAAMAQQDSLTVSFSLSAPKTENDFGVISENGVSWLVKGQRKLLREDELAMPGLHNVANVLAAMALCEAAGVDLDKTFDAVHGFTGLAHRCQPVTVGSDVIWINDSKATNVGATLAALSGMQRPVILIAGGDGKGADFSPLVPVLRDKVKQVILLGKDADVIAQAIDGAVLWFKVKDMEEAVAAAKSMAVPGDMVMLSPACASLDMYRNFAARGDHFSQLAREAYQ